ncbi:iron-regulated ABC transporter permease protein SufD [Leptolinea tardivitalis]|nr:iron-regulated ABC transporter permease protein SufD [Leptolinea tardivitalis]
MVEPMNETPVVITRNRTSTASRSTQFTFSENDIVPEKAKDLAAVREHAWEVYKTQGIPATTEEAWRRTDLSRLNAGQFGLQNNDLNDYSAATPPEEILRPLADTEQAGQIILSINDEKIKLSNDLLEKGVVFTTFSELRKNNPSLLARYIGKIVKPEEGLFPAMVQAFGQDGIFLFIPKNVKISQPLHSIIWGAIEKTARLSHVIVVLEENSEATFIHETASPENENGSAFHAGIVEILIGENARLQFVELQSLGKNVWNFSNERARVENQGTIEWTFGAIGSRLTKNFTDLDLVGEGATGKMSGFYFTDGTQHLDHDTQQNHLAPHTTSDLLFKGALLDNSHSVWQGMIYVAPGAQKTDGYQANRNLILSRNAHADSIPGLEIKADDVRCTHGATVGKIDKDELFYLLSRGIPQKEAERLIVEGFFDPIMQRIPFEGVRNRFQQYIHNKMAV